jgi:O-antigen/teichoic acid export membrane protein
VLKNIFTILRGTVAAQALGFIALPILARIYDAEAFGITQLYQSILTFLLVFAALRFEVALLKAKEGVEVEKMIHLCIFINIVTTILVSLICIAIYIFSNNISITMMSLLWGLPFGILIGGVLQSLGYLLLRQQAYGVVSVSKIAQSSGYVSTSLGTGLILSHPLGLVSSDILGRLAALIWILRKQYKYIACNMKIISAQELINLAHKFRSFPLVSLPSALVNTAGGAMTGLLMYWTFDAMVAGQYALVDRSLMLPVGMLGGVVAQVFTAELSLRLRGGATQEMATLYRRTVKRMFLLGAIPTIMVIAFAPVIFINLFGSSWELAGDLARIIAPSVFVGFAYTAVNMTITILGWQKVQLCLDILRLVLTISVWSCANIYKLTPYNAILLHVLVSTTFNLISLIIADYILRHPINGDYKYL